MIAIGDTLHTDTQSSRSSLVRQSVLLFGRYICYARRSGLFLIREIGANVGTAVDVGAGGDCWVGLGWWDRPETLYVPLGAWVDGR